ELITNNINLYDLLQMSAKYDMISYELTNKLPVIFNTGFPAYSELSSEYPLNDSAIECYLRILSTTNDTLISRKYGGQVAEEISQKAMEILESTDIQTSQRLDALNEFDEYLNENKYNPGTTADFTAASIFVSLIDKYSQSGL
ncbi:MAG: triphosphoribosyl-dephospho-CoA synthase, partial [Methanosphaera sp.]|nr:triphosphoribosyl-dephospho-CoA synthase [Methanosphaera sp.]